MTDRTSLIEEVARAFSDHGITAAITALIGGTLALLAAITRRAFTAAKPKKMRVRGPIRPALDICATSDTVRVVSRKWWKFEGGVISG